jgi:hypothetical protein
MNRVLAEAPEGCSQNRNMTVYKTKGTLVDLEGYRISPVSYLYLEDEGTTMCIDRLTCVCGSNGLCGADVDVGFGQGNGMQPYP